MRALIALMVLFCVFTSAAIAGDRPSGRNCNLPSPPADAGEEPSHGITLKTYPRAKDITSSYSGCQTLWMPTNTEGTQWAVVVMVEIKSGDPISLWSPNAEAAADMKNCVYKQGKLAKGNADECPPPELLIRKTLAPGCVKTITEAMAKDGLGAPRPEECKKLE